MVVVVIKGVVRHAKLQSNPHHQQTNGFLQAGCLSCRSTNSVKALKGEALKGNQTASNKYITTA